MTLNESDADPVRRRRRGASLEAALLEAAWDELEASGYDDFTIDAVATRAETSRAVIYRRWPNKAELVQAAVVQLVSQDRITAADTGTLRGDVIDLLRQANERRVRVAIHLVPHLGDFYRATGMSLADLRESVFGGKRMGGDVVMARAIERGEVDPAVLTPRIVALPFDLFRLELLMTYARVPDETLIAIVDEIFLPLVLRPR